MKELRMDHLTKTYGEKTLFKDISFLIHEKDRIGLIGTNGTGKTSLLNILSGQDTGEEGELQFPQNYHIGYLSQETDLDPKLTVAEAVFKGESPLLKTVRNYELALFTLEQDGASAENQKRYTIAEEAMNKVDGWSADTNAKIILQKLGIPNVQKTIGELSGGQKKRVGLAQILIEEPDLLLLDEPTNHLDYQAIDWLEGFLRQYRGAVLMVTHDRYFLDRVANRIFELSFGSLYEYQGNYETYLVEKAEREDLERKQESKRKQLYKQELSWIRAGVKARGTKQQARIDRFTDLKENLYQVNQKEQLSIDITNQRLGKKVIELKQANYSIGNQILLKDFDLLIQTQERLGITGKNGAGKSTLLNILSGRLSLTSGVYDIGETVRLAYYTQQNEDVDPNKRMIQYLQEIAEETRRMDGSIVSVPDLLEQFLFPRFMHGTIIHKLSGGEKRRLFLLKLLISQPNVLLLDEPTNDLDIDTLTVLEEYIQHFQGAVLAVSHDRYFLDKTMNKLLLFQGNGQIDTYYGSMSEYLENQMTKKSTSYQTSENKEKKAKPLIKKEKTKFTYLEKKEWDSIEDEIANLEQKSAEIKQAMELQGSDFSKLQSLQNELDEIEQGLENKMNRWEYLSQFANE